MRQRERETDREEDRDMKWQTGRRGREKELLEKFKEIVAIKP